MTNPEATTGTGSNLPAGRIAGVDYGSKRIGIAISDAAHKIASPLVGYERVSKEVDGRWFSQLVQREEISAWVVGLPVFASGDESPKSYEAREFGKWLSGVTSLPIYFFDERYSTVQAEQFLTAGNLTRKRRKQRRDMLAAQIILSAFLDSSSHRDEPQSLDDDS